MNRDFKVGIFFTAIAQYSTVIIQLVVNMVLSRLLSPKEIGIATIVQVLAFFFQLLAGAALAPAIIQNKSLSDDDYGVLFNFSLIVGVLLALIFGVAGGPALAFVYKNPIYIPLCWLMSLLILMSALGQVPNGILGKQKRFKEISVRLMISGFIGAVFGIVAAFLHAGIYAFIIVFLVTEFCQLTLNLRMAKIHYTWNLSARPIREVLPFVSHQTNFSVLNYFYRNLDNLLVGKFLGPAALGNYSKSYQLISMPITILLNVINPVVQPILSDHEQDVSLIRTTFLKICQVLAFLAFPISVFLSLNAKPIIYLLFGSQWTAAITPLSILSLSISVQMLSQAMPVFWQARNLTRFLSANAIISLIVIGTCIIIGILFGSIISVSIAVAISYLINFFISATLLLRQGLDSRLSALIKTLIKPLILGILLYFILYFVNPYLTLAGYFVTLILRSVVWLLLIALYLYITGDWKLVKSFISRQ